jgi:RHS repeat-associated protein
MSDKRKRVELGSESSLADKDGDGYIEPFNVNPTEPNGGTTDVSVDLTDTEVYQETHYYPFGMTMEGEWQNIVNGPENKYLYNGKELNTDFGLDWSDYEARWYDASIARWNSVDPLAEKFYSWSPYNYVYNNPIIFIDPDGTSPEKADCIKCAVQALKFTRKAYKIYKKTKKAGEKFTKKHLKDAGLDEIADFADDLGTIFGRDQSLADRAAASVDLLTGTDFNNRKTKAGKKGADALDEAADVGKRRRNRVPDTGEPGTVGKNAPGTTMKKYDPDGNVQKEFNKGHGKKYPKNEQEDHIHDYIPNPYKPNGQGDRQHGRKPKKNEVKKDFNNGN